MLAALWPRLELCCPWGDQRGAPLRAGCAWLREVVEKSGLLLARQLLSHVLDEHFTLLRQSNSGVMSSLTDQSQWEFPLSKSSSCYLREAEGSGLPGISQDKTHSCWQVFVSMQRAGVQKTTRICHGVVSTLTWTLGGKQGHPGQGCPSTSADEHRASRVAASGKRYTQITQVLPCTPYTLNAELIPTGCCDKV